MKKIEHRLRKLAERLKDLETEDFGYTTYGGGELERQISRGNCEVSNAIGDLIIEALDGELDDAGDQ